MTIDMVLGIKQNELVDYAGVQVNKDLVEPLDALFNRAKVLGFDFAIASGYRSFDRQLKIWNDKVRGLRPVLDEFGQALDVKALSDSQLLFAILRWSALPGASRHHWGTDVDVFDAGPSKSGYKLQLTVEETLPGGVFEGFYKWLDVELADPKALFFRPYTKPYGGVAPEPWHLSYLPLASQYQGCLNKTAIMELIDAHDVGLKVTILTHFDIIYDRFICLD